MNDIAPELLEKIQKSFEEQTKELREEIKNGVKSYEEAYNYAIEVGEALANSFGVNITSEILPDGRMYYNIADKVVRPMLKAEYELSSEAAVNAQKSANKASGIGIKVQKAEFDSDKAQGIIDRVSSQPYDEIKWILNEPVKTFSKNVVDNTIQKNVEFQGKSGLSPRIVRKASSDACKWCKAVAGTYTYPDVPQDVYRRHENCNCVVEYVEGGKYQNVWTKQIYSRSQAERAEKNITNAAVSKQKKTAIRTNKMAAISENDWSETTPKMYSKEELREIMVHITERGYKVHDIKEFDGDIELLDKQLDCLDQMQKEFPLQRGRKITISIKALDDDDFAETKVRTITFNTKTLRNENITVRNILKNSNFAERKFEDISEHEYGHVYENGRKEGYGLELAKEAYYNIYGRKPSMEELTNTLSLEISEYSTTAGIENIPREIISEALCREKNNQSEFSKELIKLMRRKQ